VHKTCYKQIGITLVVNLHIIRKFMKIAFVHAENEFTTKLLNKLKEKPGNYEIVSWVQEDAAPADDFDVALVMGKFTREQMASQTKLALIHTVSAGYDGIDVYAADEMGILVSYSPSALTGNAISVAEFALMLMLGASRHLNQALQPARENNGNAPGIASALFGKTVCIVGLGAIGRLLADRLKPFGVKLSAVDDHPSQSAGEITIFHTDELLKAVADADYVVLCVRAKKENENLINGKTLKAMKKGAILVNIARGTLVDEAALFDAVNSGHIMAAGLDVTKKEPVDPQNLLLSLPQVLVTPHIAGATDITLTGMAAYAIKVITGFAAGKNPEALVNGLEKVG
jgi:phosphoglycerate dehydrogenase-like enzyme